MTPLQQFIGEQRAKFVQLWAGYNPRSDREGLDMKIKSFLTSAILAADERARKEAMKILEEEISLAHTTTSGKTSRLTSAYNRISGSLYQPPNLPPSA